RPGVNRPGVALRRRPAGPVRGGFTTIPPTRNVINPPPRHRRPARRCGILAASGSGISVVLGTMRSPDRRYLAPFPVLRWFHLHLHRRTDLLHRRSRLPWPSARRRAAGTDPGRFRRE